MASTLPRPLDFAVVGAAKSGTSSLGALLAGHSGTHVLAPKDGHHFLPAAGDMPYTGPRDHVFNNTVNTSGASYAEQLRTLDRGIKVGDASVFYMTDRAVLEALKDEMVDGAPVVAVLRRPDARAYSAYMHMVREGLEDGSFAEGLAKEGERLAAGWQPIWGYRKLGHYAPQVENLFEVFGRERVHVLLYEDLTRDPRTALGEVFEALGLDWEDVTLHHNNASGVPRSRAMQRFLSDANFIKSAGRKVIPRDTWLRVRRWIQHRNLQRVPMPPEQRSELITYYQADIERLQELLGRDLSAWTN